MRTPATHHSDTPENPAPVPENAENSSSTPVPTTASAPASETAPPGRILWLLYLATFLAALFFVWALVEMVAVNRTKTDLESKMAASQAQFQSQLALDRQLGLNRTADAVAASIAPAMVLRGQVPEVTDRTLQAAVQNLLNDRGYRFVAIADPSGKVLASSDLAVVGKSLPPLPGSPVARAPIGDHGSLGTVVLQSDAP